MSAKTQRWFPSSQKLQLLHLELQVARPHAPPLAPTSWHHVAAGRSVIATCFEGNGFNRNSEKNIEAKLFSARYLHLSDTRPDPLLTPVWKTLTLWRSFSPTRPKESIKGPLHRVLLLIHNEEGQDTLQQVLHCHFFRTLHLYRSVKGLTIERQPDWIGKCRHIADMPRKTP